MSREIFTKQNRMEGQSHPMIWERDAFAEEYISNLSRAFLYLTERCNLSCRGCYVNASGRGESAPLVYMQDAIHTVKYFGAKSVSLMGGEPTIWPNIVPLIDFSGKEGLKVVLDTNGERKAQIVLGEAAQTIGNVQRFLRVNVSIDSDDEQEHNLARGDKNNWQHVVEMVKLAKNLGFVVSATSTITSRTVNKTLDILHFIEDLGIEESNLHVISFEGRTVNNPDLLVPPTLWLKAVEQIISHGSFPNLNVRFPVVFGPSNQNRLGDTVLADKKPEWVYRCVGEDNADRLGIRPNGLIHVCALIGFAGFEGFKVTKEGKIITLFSPESRTALDLQPKSEIELFRLHKKNPTTGCPATMVTGEKDPNLPDNLIYLCRSVKITLPAKDSESNYFNQQYPDNKNLAAL